uniref:DUF1640 domain-containing protein n=1 Tax=Candidatus Kentrum sp. LFY TaxID=2126342 RepID=A0A450WH26_9GAMM|nr:MAG: hypothetical protein BECKLFY1418C_GA0070996_102234 [Candidatus Kentron sp. LFY]
MTSIPIDTHGFVETLRKAGVPEQQAIAHKDAICNASFATGPDLREVEQRIHTEMARGRAEIIRWVVGAALAQTVLLIALFEMLSKSV